MWVTVHADTVYHEAPTASVPLKRIFIITCQINLISTVRAHFSERLSHMVDIIYHCVQLGHTFLPLLCLRL